MNYLFILVFVLIIMIITLAKWLLVQLIKIKELKNSVSILNKEHNAISKENIELRELLHNGLACMSCCQKINQVIKLNTNYKNANRTSN